MTPPGDGEPPSRANETRRRLMRLLEPNRLGRAPALRTAPREADGDVASSAQAPRPAPPPAPRDPPAPLARKLAALRGGGQAWAVEPVPASRAQPSRDDPPPAPQAPPPAPPTGLAARLVASDAAARLDEPAPPPPSPLRQRLDALRRSAGHVDGPAPVRVVDAAADFERLFPAAARPTPHGPAWVLQDRFEPDTPHGNRTPGDVRALPTGAALRVLTGDPAFDDFDLRGALFLDLESTGLALAGGTLPFLVGCAHFQGETLVFEQWLLREPDDEAAALHDLAARVAEADWLVTFNGRTFDLPLLRTRWRLNRQRDPSEGLAGHLDLLPVSRRLLKHDLPDCRLGTLERHVLGLLRIGDVAGSEVPGCYHAWLHDRNPTPLAGVVKHNRLDVLSMVTLLDELLGRVVRPEATLLRDPACALKLAERARRNGAPELARAIYTAALDVPAARAGAELGLRRLDRPRRKRPTPNAG